jgi:hypothetical protein
LDYTTLCLSQFTNIYASKCAELRSGTPEGAIKAINWQNDAQNAVQSPMGILCCAASRTMELFQKRKDVNAIGGISIVATEEMVPNVSKLFI